MVTDILSPEEKRKDMARKLITQLIDDLDGSLLEEGGETVRFSLEGRAYEIDLSTANAEKFRETFAPYVSAARSVGTQSRGSGTRTRSARGSSGRDLGAIREWAREHGHSVSERGRLSGTVLAAYDAAH